MFSFDFQNEEPISDLEEDSDVAEFDESDDDSGADRESDGGQSATEEDIAHEEAFGRNEVNEEDNIDDNVEAEEVSDHEDENQPNEEEQNEDFPLFGLDHSSLDTDVNLSDEIRARDILLLALAMSVRHNWTYEAIIDHLQCQNALLDMPCLPKSKTKLWTILRRQASELEYHAYCNSCGVYLGLRDQLGMNVECTNDDCDFTTTRSKVKYFITLDLKKQLQRFLSIPGIAELLQYRFNRKKRHPDSLQDIFDGAEFKRLIREGKLSLRDFTYVFNTDGVKVMKGAKLSAWPLYIRLNELPPNLRQKYLFLAGVWVDHSDPVMNVFLTPFVDQANELSSVGVTWKPDGRNGVVSKFFPLCQCVDSKARYALLNMTQYNGKFGCTFCDIKGVYSKTRRYPMLHPYDVPIPNLRLEEQVVQDMLRANDGPPIKGIKGVSALMNMQNFRMVDGQALDDLHGLYEGNAKHHTHLLMRIKGRTSLKMRAEIINARLKKVKYPSQLSRSCEDITKRKSWKGSQWRSWLLFLGVVCFDDLIPKKYIDHYALLSHAAFLMSQDEISPQDIPVINTYLTKYVGLFEKYFGLDHMYYNVHLLVHFLKSILRYGPSWVVSTLGFESWNWKCVTMQVHSAQGAIEQIAHRHLIKAFVNVALHLDIDVAPQTKAQLLALLTKKRRDITYQLGDVYFLGEEKKKIPTREEQLVLQREGFPAIQVLYKYEKVLFKSVLYTSTASVHSNARSDDSEIYTWIDTFGAATSFVRFQHATNEISGIFMNEHEVEPLRPARHIAKVTSPETLLHFVKFNDVRSPVVSLKLGEDCYLVPLANCYEID